MAPFHHASREPLTQAELDALLGRYLGGGLELLALATEAGYSAGYFSTKLRRHAIARGLYAQYRAAVRANKRRAYSPADTRQTKPSRAVGPWREQGGASNRG